MWTKTLTLSLLHCFDIELLKNIRVRINLVDELITSEQNYVEFLTLMKDVCICQHFKFHVNHMYSVRTEIEFKQTVFSLYVDVHKSIERQNSDEEENFIGRGDCSIVR